MHTTRSENAISVQRQQVSVEPIIGSIQRTQQRTCHSQVTDRFTSLNASASSTTHRSRFQRRLDDHHNVVPVRCSPAISVTSIFYRRRTAATTCQSATVHVACRHDGPLARQAASALDRSGPLRSKNETSRSSSSARQFPRNKFTCLSAVSVTERRRTQHVTPCLSLSAGMFFPAHTFCIHRLTVHVTGPRRCSRVLFSRFLRQVVCLFQRSDKQPRLLQSHSQVTLIGPIRF